MKKALYIILLTAVVINSCICFSACSKFEGSTEHFTQSGDFYSNVFNTLGSALGGDSTFINLFNNDKTTGVNLNATLENYKYKGELVGDGKGSIDVSTLITPEYDFSANIALDAFSQKTAMDFATLNNDMLIKFDSKDMPFYYKGEGEGFVKTAVAYFKEELNNAKLITGNEAYKLHGTNISANTVEFCFNSDVTARLANKITSLLINTPNLALNAVYFPIQEHVYTIQEEKLHLTWKRYYDDSVLCRESFKLHDNYNHYYLLDIAFVNDGSHSYVEISLKAYNGDYTITVFTASVDKESKKDGGFTTKAQVIIGDEVYITAENSGTSQSTKGKANINFVTEVGEVSLPIDFSYSCKDDEGKQQTFNAALSNIFVSFDLSVDITSTENDKQIVIEKPYECYDLTSQEDIFVYSYISNPLFTHAFSNTWREMLGKPIEEPQIPDEETDPFALDIAFDSGTQLETNGEYGKKYIDILQSDDYTYKYYTYEDVEGIYKTTATEYRKDGDIIYHFQYSDNKKYSQLLKDNTKFEVHYDIEKIIYSEYEEANFKAEFPKPNYQYYQSGNCVYEERDLIYERYFDKSNNYYTFIFNENGEVEIISLYVKSEDSTLYMFVEEISSEVPDNALQLPNYEKVSVQDFFD